MAHFSWLFFTAKCTYALIVIVSIGVNQKQPQQPDNKP